MATRKSRAEIEQILSGIKFMDREFRLLEKGDGFLLQLQYVEPDVETGRPQVQRSRKWYVSPWMTETEVVETAWACCKRSMLHVASEHFTYLGRRVYSQHFRVVDRLGICEAPMDRRDPKGSVER